MSTKKATPDMAENVYNLANDCGALSTQNGKMQWSKQMLDSFISNPDSFVLCYMSEDKIAGVIICMYSPDFFKLHIENLFVSPENRNKNIGENLVNNAIDFAKKKGAKYVCSLNSNLDGYFEKLGFNRGNIFNWYCL